MAQVPKTSVDIVFGAMTLGKKGFDYHFTPPSLQHALTTF
jgi:hypothetical protein